MAEGRSNAAIARHLTVTETAVNKHISSIFTELDLPVAATNTEGCSRCWRTCAPDLTPLSRTVHRRGPSHPSSWTPPTRTTTPNCDKADRPIKPSPATAYRQPIAHASMEDGRLLRWRTQFSVRPRYTPIPNAVLPQGRSDPVIDFVVEGGRASRAAAGRSDRAVRPESHSDSVDPDRIELPVVERTAAIGVFSQRHQCLNDFVSK
ncbi:hypothetical protein [Allokutzneria oryzae]|uniref:HTH luxR-type domain-containing protein n=1 Tax=Allokutzneria oryzae TaxID=1378989 RepID=A0ABV6A2U2_9PSEU